MELRKPVLIEGQAGVGKTEIAKVLAASLETELIRLQCYEGLDASSALYEWNYPKQMLHIRLQEAAHVEGRSVRQAEAEIFSEPYLLQRPLLRAISHPDRAPVLLIDEVDRADEEFEAFLLEVLSDFQVTIPELGTVKAEHRPYVVLTSNRTRELSDALKRRCLYLWIDYPDFEKEVRIIESKVEGINHHLAEQVAGFMQVVRRVRLGKTPGMAESIDWAMSLMALHADHLEPEAVNATLGAILKDRDDVNRLSGTRAETIISEIGRLDPKDLATAAPSIAQRIDKELAPRS
ncbi:MAG: MoxR family ATPase [Chloroflexi bacterium]|nr:MoxR family ATPase [Chloroflexota bacterium]